MHSETQSEKLVTTSKRHTTVQVTSTIHVLLLERLHDEYEKKV